MEDTPEIKSDSQESKTQEYLEKIGSEDKGNLAKFTKLFVETLQKDGLEGFIYAVGGTVTHDNPQDRKDIDMLVGVKKEPGDLTKLNHLGKCRRRYQIWKETMDKVFYPLKEQGVEIEEEAIYEDAEFPNLAGNDGKTILKFPNGRPIEILCHQDTEIGETPILLFSNENKQAA